MRRSPPDPGPLATHEHEWRPVEDPPVIEDGAAIFHLQCDWVEITSSVTSEKHDETFYGTGAECEETRTYRFEYSTLESPEGEEFELHDITEWEENDDDIAERVITIEEAFHTHGPSDKVSWDVDPDPDCGVVTIEHDGWTLRYEP